MMRIIQRTGNFFKNYIINEIFLKIKNMTIYISHIIIVLLIIPILVIILMIIMMIRKSFVRTT